MIGSYLHTFGGGSSLEPLYPPPPFPFLNILWKWNNYLVAMRPTYFIFIEYLRKMNWNQQSEPNKPLYWWTPSPEILIPPFTLVNECAKYEQAKPKRVRNICFTGHTARTGLVNPFQLNEIFPLLWNRPVPFRFKGCWVVFFIFLFKFW